MTAFPTPLVAIRSPADSRLLEDLRRVRHIGLWETEKVSPAIAGLSARVGGVILATSADPMETLTQAVVAGAVGPFVVVTTVGASYYESVTLRCIGRVGRLNNINLGPVLAPRSAMPLYCRELSVMIDPLEQVVWTSQGRRKLPPTTLAVLFHLASAKGAALSSERLRRLVWPDGIRSRQYGQLLEYYLSQLRKALRAWQIPLRLRVIKDFGHVLERAERK